MSTLKLGMNITATTPRSDSGFIKSCRSEGLDSVRLRLGSDPGEFEGYVKILKKLKMKAYIVVSLGSDALECFHRQGLIHIYAQLCKVIPKELCLGFALPENAHAVLRRGRSKEGIRKLTLVKMLNDISAMIRGCGHRVVMPVRVEEIKGNVWSGVDCDVYDLDFMVPTVPPGRSFFDLGVMTWEFRNMQIWIGRCGIMGGCVNSSQQARFLRVIREYAGAIDRVFLWSEVDCEYHKWTDDGKFMVKVGEGGTVKRAIGRKGAKGRHHDLRDLPKKVVRKKAKKVVRKKRAVKKTTKKKASK